MTYSAAVCAPSLAKSRACLSAVANAFATALKQARDFAADGAQTAAEYVTEESRDVVPKAELDAFHDDVDALRDDLERLAARVARLNRAGGRA